MRSLVFSKAIGGPVVVRCVVLKQRNQLKASDSALGGAKIPCTVKTCTNFAVGEGKY